MAMNPVSAARRNLTLGLLFVVAVLSYVDRQVLTVLMEVIKQDLVLTDTVLGLLSGVSFAIFYVAAAFPIARYSDRGDRRLVIAVSITVWSAATALCGAALNAWHLALARIGVASAEAGAGPAAQSLLVDIFPKDRRTLVLSTLLAANSVGLAVGLALSGWLAQYFSWRMVFVIVGLPGILVGLLVWWFAAEPRREGAVRSKAPDPIPVRAVLKTMLASRSLSWFALLLVTVPVTGFAFLTWSPSFFQRIHHFSVVETGFWLGGATAGGLVLGNFVAGWVTDKYGQDNLRFNGLIAGWGLLATFPFALGFVLAPNPMVSLGCFMILKFLMTLHLGPMIALSFAQVPAAMRAMMGATINMFITLAGVGFGSFLAGRMSDAFAARFGTESLRYSLLVICFLLLIGALAGFMAGRTAKPLEEQP
jgi:MFS family permease